jgi:hypothetical protein
MNILSYDIAPDSRLTPTSAQNVPTQKQSVLYNKYITHHDLQQNQMS